MFLSLVKMQDPLFLLVIIGEETMLLPIVKMQDPLFLLIIKGEDHRLLTRPYRQRCPSIQLLTTIQTPLNQ
uniref:Uncharacterized protein n=1 Tax=Candidozyma auris TaxID=498019 RepID=A0A0L0NS59_CANAR